MPSLRNIVREAASAAMGLRFQQPAEGTYDGIGRIVNVGEQYREAFDLNDEQYHVWQRSRYEEEGLSIYRVEFNSRGVEIGNGLTTRAANIPINLVSEAKKNVGRMVVCNIGEVPDTRTYEVKSFSPFTN